MKPIDLSKYIIFSLGDFEKTKSKYENYKPKSSIEDDDDLVYACLDYGVDFWCISQERWLYFEHVFTKNAYELSQKQLLKTLHTFINNQTFDYNTKAYKDRGYTDSQARSLAIRFYIRNYEAINARMQEMMIDAILSYATVFTDEVKQQAEQY